jgi:hypothetical protein
MQVNELCRSKELTGETIVKIEAGKQLVRLINTYTKDKALDEILYVLACRRLAERMA